jgi:DNA-binding NtrC family response regulator
MDAEGKQLHIRLPSELFKKLKVKCAFDGISIQEYVIALITENMGPKAAEKGSILIIDDEAVVRESLRDSLQDTHNVTIAETGEEGLELVKKQDFDILIVDVRLPGKSGLEVIKEVKDINPYIRSIVITAYPSVELSVQAMKQGAVDYIVKPVRVDDLEKLINENLRKRTLRRKEQAQTKGT